MATSQDWRTTIHNSLEEHLSSDVIGVCQFYCKPRDIIVADTFAHRIQVFTSEGEFIRSFGARGIGPGQLERPFAVAVDQQGGFLVGDSGNHPIQTFNRLGTFVGFLGQPASTRKGSRTSFAGVTAARNQIAKAIGVDCHNSDYVFATDYDNHNVQIFSVTGRLLNTFGTQGSNDGQFSFPWGVAVDAQGRVAVSDHNHRVQLFTPTGRFLCSFGGKGGSPGQLHYPRGLAVDSHNRFIVADSANSRIQLFSPEGQFLTQFGSFGSGTGHLDTPVGVAVDSDDNIIVADRNNNRVVIWAPSGKLIRQFGCKGTGPGQFTRPCGVAC